MKFYRGMFLLPLVLAGQSLVAGEYYVSSTHGDDRNPGTKSTTPWRSLAKINQLKLQGGDRIWLMSGDKFLDAGLVFLPDDQGTAVNPIIIDIFGGTDRAIIMPPRGQHGISIHNTAGITIRNLHLLGRGPEVSDATERHGVSLWCDLKDGRKLSGLRFEGLLVSWFYLGISIGAGDPSYSGFADVIISDCTVKSCLADGIVSFGHMPGSAENQSHRNLQILRTTVAQCYGDPTLQGPHSGSGIIMAGTKGGLIEHCVAHDNGGGTNDRDGGGPVGIWCWGADSVTIQHCLVYNQKSTPGVQDGGGFDIDGGSTNCVIQSCFSYNNEGYGYLVCEFEGAAPIVNATVRYNISWNDGRARGQSGLGIWNGNPTVTSFREVVFHNNLVVCDETAGSAVKMGFESKPLEAAFYNNVFVRTGGSKLIEIDRHTDQVTFKGNLYWSKQGLAQWRWGTESFSSLMEWRGAPGNPETHNGQTVGHYADPKLEALEQGHAATRTTELSAMTAFLPQPGSPLLNAALKLDRSLLGHSSASALDFRGSALPPEPNDMGPYEQ